VTRSDATTVEDRLRVALSAPLESMRDGVDMSQAAITQRLRDACEMATLCLKLADSQALGPADLVRR
jgi:hypothetical protein